MANYVSDRPGLARQGTIPAGRTPQAGTAAACLLQTAALGAMLLAVVRRGRRAVDPAVTWLRVAESVAAVRHAGATRGYHTRAHVSLYLPATGAAMAKTASSTAVQSSSGPAGHSTHATARLLHPCPIGVELASPAYIHCMAGQPDSERETRDVGPKKRTPCAVVRFCLVPR